MDPLHPGEINEAGLPEASPLGLRFARGAFWALMGTVVSQGLFLLASMALARLLGKEQFGGFDVINGTVLMFGVFAGLDLEGGDVQDCRGHLAGDESVPDQRVELEFIGGKERSGFLRG